MHGQKARRRSEQSTNHLLHYDQYLRKKRTIRPDEQEARDAVERNSYREWMREYSTYIHPDEIANKPAYYNSFDRTTAYEKGKLKPIIENWPRLRILALEFISDV